MKKRIQLTLFLERSESEQIEQIRKEYNPVQYGLIRSHVTLCREDELEEIDKVIQTLSVLKQDSITIDFGPVTRFSEGKGVLLPATGENEPFHLLRAKVLQAVTIAPRKHLPHITLLHPRNAVCTDSLFEEIQKIALPSFLHFKKISLIEQEDGNVWRIIEEFPLVY